MNRRILIDSLILPLMLLAGMIFTTSCIRDDIPECPPLKVRVVVKDKNYFNVDKVDLEQNRSEDLSFREYVPTVYWILRDAESGKVVQESDLIRLSGDEEEFLPDIDPDLPHGRYELTVWGGLENLDVLHSGRDAVDFHPADTEGCDIYVTHDELLYDAWNSEYTVEMERAKGKLIIEKVDLPEDVTHSVKTITGLYGMSDHSFQYGGESRVSTFTAIPDPGYALTKTMLSPSTSRDATVVGIEFRGGENGESVYVPANVNITMRRNELTVLRYAWDSSRMEFRISVLINGNWEVITQMDLD